MKISITAKLFLAVLATAAFALLAMGFAAHWSFTRGFVGYLNEQAAQRLEAAAPRFAAAWRERGSWESLRGNRSEWFRLMRPVPGEDMPADQAATPSPLVSDLTGAVLRFSLLDASRRFVVGYPELHPNSVLRELEVHGRTVGWLAMAPFQSVSAAADVRFQQSQIRASWTVGAVCVLLAAVIALWIARSLLRPVRQVAQATHRLAAGQYTSRVQVASDDEVGQLARNFNTMADTLQKNEQMRRDFIADVSHELRTPLGVLHGELEAMEDGVHKLGPASIQSLQTEVATLNKLVSDLYDLSLADVGALTYRKQQVDLGEVLAATAEAFGSRFAERRIETTLELSQAPLNVHADERRLQQLFNNLLENAVRYTDPIGRLRLRAQREGAAVVVDVEDTAPGVPEDRLPRLFDRFYRVESSRNRASGGAGLGLAICRSIVLAHDGEIEARHSLLGGLRITIRLPAAD